MNENVANSTQSGEPMGAGAPSETIAEQVTMAEAGPVFTEKKSNRWMLLGLILCLVLAVGGIGFGVWAMMDKNTQVNNLNGQIASLKSQVATLQEQVGDDTSDIWNNFSSNLTSQSLNVRGNYYHYNGSNNELYWMSASKDENGHLIITDYGDGSPNYDSRTILEIDDVLVVYYVEVGNGSVPYFYIVDEGGNVSRLDIMETSDRQLEKVGDYNEIVTVVSAPSLEAILVDIDGNIYKSF